MRTTTTRKRRRTQPSDWQLPLLTDWGLAPKQQRLLVVIAAVAGVLVLAVGLVTVVGSLGSGYLPARSATAAVAGPDTARPTVFHGWSSPKLFDPVADRAKDAKPLTQKEVFAERTLSGAEKLSLKLVKSELGGDCAAVLWGQTLVDQVTEGGCTQAARGMYLSSDGRYIAQYTLLNLRDGKAAGAVVEGLKTGYRGGWTLPLDTSKAVFTAGGHSEAGAYALGHYVGLVWTARADGADPTPKDDFVSLALTVRGAEKAVYRRVVAITGTTS
ncbi:hypothetical protein OIE66_25885 [Nonomuraea sp. NBC_01738]|uniref:hypothetical protein n=1 Tax=Nonomuraea sp. NBC_01738 TaxID=2976003 RepID=UPI002E0E7BDB|nr:hypothetical protein OIE66_25885 [Nonomuraea sp. NBC_01738]